MAPVGSSQCRPGRRFGYNPSYPLASPRLHGPYLLSDVVLRLWPGQLSLDDLYFPSSPCGMSEMGSSTSCSNRYRSGSHWGIRSLSLSVASGITERSSLVRDIVYTVWPHLVLSAPCDCNSTRQQNWTCFYSLAVGGSVI